MSPATAPLDAGPDKTPRIFAALLAARAAFGLAYLSVALGKLPVPWYYPLEHRWDVAPSPTHGLGMGWFGSTGASIVAALLAGCGLYAITARGALGRTLARTAVVLALARAGGLVLLVDYAYFGWTLTHQTPKPLADPCPR